MKYLGKTFRAGQNGMVINIPKHIIDAYNLQLRELVEIDLVPTGQVLPKRIRNRKTEEDLKALPKDQDELKGNVWINAKDKEQEKRRFRIQ